MSIYEQAVAKFGADHQILKAVEELNELAVALMHYRDGKATKEDVLNEMADVEILHNQLNVIFGEIPLQIFSDKVLKLDNQINQ